MSTLVEILTSQNELEKFLSERGGEITSDEQMVDEFFKSISTDLQTKVDGYAVTLEDLRTRAVNAYEKSQQWLLLSKRLTTVVERLEGHMIQSMISFDKLRLPGKEYEATVRQNPPRVVIDDESQIPATYSKQKITLSVDKMAIKEAIKNGMDVPGAHLERDFKLEMKEKA